MSTRCTVEWVNKYWILRTHHETSEEGFTMSFVCFTPSDLKQGRIRLPAEVKKLCQVARETKTKQTGSLDEQGEGR